MDMKWRKSSRSNTNGGACVEVAEQPGTIYVRDSKDQTGPALSFDGPAFQAFIEGTKAGRFDLR